MRTVLVTTTVVATLVFGAWFVMLRDTGASGPFLTATARATAAAQSVLNGIGHVGVTGDLEKLTKTVNDADTTMRREAATFEQLERQNGGAAAAIAADTKKSAERATIAFETIVASLLVRGQVTDVDSALADLGAVVVAFDDAAVRWKEL